MTNAVTKFEAGALPAVPSVLGSRRIVTQVGGVIRPGIKVLTSKAASHDRARAIYEKGVAAGLSFDQIEKQLKEELDLAYPLAPKNVPYFTARHGDFAMKEVADDIMARFGEDRGDGVKRLYRFPVVFASDSLLDVMPHKLEVYGAGSIKFWSEFDEDGNRTCMTFAGVPKRADGKAIRIFGGRKHVPRPDTNGACDPEKCDEYQNRECNVSGKVIFYIPGVASVLPLAIPSRSIYGFDAIRDTLSRIAEMRGGRISGFLKDREGFWITKTLREVPHIDENGKAVRVAHWIISLEVKIDPTALLPSPGEVNRAANTAADVLQGVAERIDERTGEVQPAGPAIGHVVEDDWTIGTVRAATGEPVKAMAGSARPAAARVFEADDDDDRGTEQRQPAAARSQGRASTQANVSGAPGLPEVENAAKGIGIDPALFMQFADKKWGKNWIKNATAVKRAVDMIEDARENPAGLMDQIRAETEVFS